MLQFLSLPRSSRSCRQPSAPSTSSEVFDYPHRRVAEVVGLSEANARQLGARRRIRGASRAGTWTPASTPFWSRRSWPRRRAATSPGSRTCSRPASTWGKGSHVCVAVFDGHDRGGSVRGHIVRDHCRARTVDAPIYGGRYRPLFEDLPPLRVDESALHALGRPRWTWAISASTPRTAAPIRGSPRCGPSSGSSSPMTSPRIAHRWCIAPTRADPQLPHPKANLEGVYGAGPVGLALPADQDDPAKLLLSPSGKDVPRNHAGHRADRNRATTCISSPARWWWRSSSCTTGWSTGCATTASPIRTSSRRRGGRPRGTTST